MTKYIISAAQGGLSNRVKCLISSMKISEETGRELLLYWPKDYSCNNLFSELFENKIQGIKKETLRKIIKSKNFSFYKKDMKEKDKEKKVWILESPNFTNFSKKKIDLKFSEEGKKKILEYLSKLKIQTEILKKANYFYEKYFSKEIIGVHLRGGDFKKISTEIGKVTSEAQMILELKKELKRDQRKRFFLATEDLKTEKRFREMFGNRIITYPKKTLTREEEGSVREALIDLLLLSKTKKIFGSYGSTFTEFAWYLGKCNPKIKIILDEDALKSHLKKEQKRNSFLQEIKRVIYNMIVPLDKRILDQK